MRISALPAGQADAAGTTAWASIRYGLSLIRSKNGLWELLLIFTGINLFAALTYFGVLPTLVLARIGGDELALAAVQTALGVGGSSVA